MAIEHQYAEPAEIINIIYTAVQNIDAIVTFYVRGNIVHSFDPRDMGTLTIGKNVNVEFYLLTLKTSKINDKRAEFSQLSYNGRLLDYHYRIYGEIRSFVKSQECIVDCGIYVNVELLKNHDYKIGDYILAEGRLDFRIIET